MKKMKLKLIIALCSIGTFSFGQIQSLDFYSYRLNNMFNVNPAYAGYTDGINIYTSGLAQMKNVAYNTKALSFGIFSRLSDQQALGGNIITDARGAFNSTKVNLSYAYTENLTKMPVFVLE